MIIWSGLGCLVPIILFACVAIAGVVMATLSAVTKTEFVDQGWFLFGAALVAAALVWVIGVILNRGGKRELIDPETNEVVTVGGSNHTLFFVPMQYWAFVIIILGIVWIFVGKGDPPETVSLTEARKGFTTKLVRQDKANLKVKEPPSEILRRMTYEAPSGRLVAYLTPPPADEKKRAAVIWITGGDCNSIDDGCWLEGNPKNEQSAAAIRKAGIVMMFPSLRGGNENLSVKESFFGEVDDILAARDFLSRKDYIDPARIYLGGHSTGGTLALLVAASTDKFRAVFSFGPAADIQGYGPPFHPFDTSNKREFDLRAPGRWMHSIRCPTFIFEGTTGQANVRDLRQLRAAAANNPLVRTYEMAGHDHFSTLYPVTRLIAAKIQRDEGAKTNIEFSEQELNNAR